MTSDTKRIHAVDALRAIAVLPVILFHLNSNWLAGGYLGVDVFFVISGYLITGIIAKEISQNTFTFTGFYRRRIRRILPALIGLMCGVLVAGALINPIQLNEVARQIRAVILINGNGALCDNVGNYWGTDALADPLLHTWSLGVEEQFYLLFPLLIWILVKYQGIGRALVYVLGLSLISFLWFLAQTVANPPKAFYLLLPRSWELMAGASIALAKIPDAANISPRRRISAAGWIGLAIILTAYVLPDYGSVFQRLRPLLAVPGVMLFLWGMKSESSLYRAIAHPIMVWIGLVSYSLYLWHWPVIVFLKTWNAANDNHLNSLFLVLFALGLTIPLAAASYYWIEQPLRRIGSVPIILLSLVLTYVVAGLASGYFGRPQLYASRNPVSLQADDQVGGFRGMTCQGGLYSSNTAVAHAEKFSSKKFGALKFVSKQPVRPIDHITVGGDLSARKTILFWGDSHACVLAAEVDAQALMLGYRVIYHILDGGNPTPNFALPETGKWIKDMFRSQVSESAQEINRFNALGRRLIEEKPDVLLFVSRYDRRSFESMRPFLEEATRHTRLFVVQQPPVLDIPDVCSVDYFAFQRDRNGKHLGSLKVSESPPAKVGREDFEGKFFNHFSMNKRVIFIPTQDLLKNTDGSLKWWDSHGCLYYIDTNHLSPFGAGLVGPRIAQALLQPRE
jgi:peptidoglycan/LPS O-acetylase OafA/YrhL